MNTYEIRIYPPPDRSTPGGLPRRNEPLTTFREDYPGHAAAISAAKEMLKNTAGGYTVELYVLDRTLIGRIAELIEHAEEVQS